MEIKMFQKTTITTQSPKTDILPVKYLYFVRNALKTWATRYLEATNRNQEIMQILFLQLIHLIGIDTISDGKWLKYLVNLDDRIFRYVESEY